MKINQLAYNIGVIENKRAITAFKAEQKRRDAKNLDLFVKEYTEEKDALIVELKWQLFMISLHMKPKAFVRFATKYWKLL